MSMLLVEDDEFAAEAMTLALTRHGYQVTRCEDSMEALKHLRKGHKPSLILLDLWTPNMDGWQFRVEQRREAAWADIPVVAISADSSAMAAAIDTEAFLSKPVDEGLLLETIRTVLARQRNTTVASAAVHAVDLSNALHLALDALAAARSHCRFLTKGVSGLAEARARALSTQLMSAQRAAHQMADIVDHARVCANTSELPTGTFDVSRTLRQSLALIEPELPPGTEVSCDLAETPLIEGDAAKLMHVFANVLRNAAEAMLDCPEPILQVATWVDPDACVVALISDSGCGVALDERERIFDAFYSLGKRRLAQGLGLTVARSLLSELGGTISIMSAPTIGSTIRITLRREATVHPRGRPRESGRPHVLLVDDDPRMLTSVRDALVPHFEVSALRSWTALSQLSQGRTFDLVLYNNTRSETRARSFFAALALRFPEHAGRVVFLQDAQVESHGRTWLDEVGIWQIEDTISEAGLVTRLMRLLQLWSSLALRNPRYSPVRPSGS